MAGRPQRPGVTPGNTGRSKLDVGGLAAGLAGVMGGGADAATTGAGSGADDPSVLASRGAGASSVMVKPGFWSNVATHGQSGLNYSQFQYNQKLQEQQGDQALSQISARGGEDRTTKVAEGEQNRLTAAQQQAATEHLAMTNAAIEYMAKNGIPFTPENYKMAVGALTGPAMVAAGNRASQLVTETGNADEYAKSTLGKEQQGAGQGAGYMQPLFKNLSQIPTVGSGQVAAFSAPGFNFKAMGSQPLGLSSVKTTSMDAKGMPVETDTTRSSFAPSSVSSQVGELKLPPVDGPTPITTKDAPYDDQEERQIGSPAISVKPITQQPQSMGGAINQGALINYLLQKLIPRAQSSNETVAQWY